MVRQGGRRVMGGGIYSRITLLSDVGSSLLKMSFVSNADE